MKTPEVTNIKETFLQYRSKFTHEFDIQRAAINFACLFAGDRNKIKRQEIMHQLTGLKLPIAKCGINAIEQELNKIV